jgi:LuxR family transcriptional regulator, maltose regulon positive regulatory protein
LSQPPVFFREPLLKTKLSVPQLRSRLVTRPRLFSGLAEGTGRNLTLICAPAGYGKTTLLVEWISNYPRDNDSANPIFCWLSLDERDNDPTRFLGYLIAAIESNCTNVSKEARSLLLSFPQPPPQTVLAFLINDLTALTVPITLVLDDYQFISNPIIHNGIAFFLDRLPDAVHLVIATRTDPPIPLAKLRARNQLIEIRADQLRFSSDEAVAFLHKVMQLPLSLEEISTLEARTEGWAAGLQMAALSIQGRSDTHQFISAFSGSHRYILDYLAEEVFNHQPENVQHFLLTTSILDRLCGELCDALLESGFASSQSLLEYLDHANLFLVALDNERRWYRYHHLFADLLHARLYQSQPDSVPGLYRRASAWFDQNDLPTEAIQYALSASNFESAAELIERHGTIRWSQGDPTLLMLASHLPLEILQKHPKLSICRAWMMIAQGQSPAAFMLLDGLVDQLPTEPLAESIWLPAFINLLYGFAAQQSGAQVHAPIPDYHALELIPESDVGLRDTADFLYAFLLNRQGDFKRSAEILECCVQRETASNGPIAIFLVIGLLARIRIMQGKLPEQPRYVKNI